MIVALASLLLTATTATAQDTLRDAVKLLMTNQGVPTGDVARDREAAEASHDVVARALLLNLTSAPLGTSSGGFLYRLNPELGTVERVSQNFGTFLVDRAVMGGAGSVSFGITGLTVGYDRLNGYDLRDGGFVTVANRFRDEALPFDTESLTLRLRTSTMLAIASVGVDDDLELGIVVPFASIGLEGERVSVYRGTPIVQATATGSASGLGDIAVRADTAFSAREPPASPPPARCVSRPATKRTCSGRLDVMASDRRGVVRNGAGRPARERRNRSRGSVGRDAPRRCAGSGPPPPGDVHDRGAATPGVPTEAVRADERAYPTVAGVDTLRLTASLDGSTLLTVATGVKWNVTDTLLFSGQIMWALNDRGLTAPMTPMVGLEYSIR